MDGIVPCLYLAISFGVAASLILSLASLILSLRGREIRGGNSSRLARANLVIASAVTIIFLASINTIIGYGFLVYLVPLQAISSLAIYLYGRRRESRK